MVIVNWFKTQLKIMLGNFRGNCYKVNKLKKLKVRFKTCLGGKKQKLTWNGASCESRRFVRKKEALNLSVTSSNSTNF